MADTTQNPVRLSDYPKDNAAPKMSKEQLPLWDQADIIESRWNKYFPYQLLVVRATPSPDGKSVNYSQVGGFSFTLPIPPQELNIDMPIATSVQALLGGVAEIHGGAPFRNITLIGTTGVNPRRASAESGRDAGAIGNVVQGIFAGSIQAANRAAASAQAVVSGRTLFPNMYTDGATSSSPVTPNSTGYYQYQLLERFIESYVALKSRNRTDSQFKDTRQLRLALAIWKDDAVYLCSGVQLAKRKSASDPHLINYTLQLKAWSRVQLDNQVSGTFDHQFLARDANALTGAFNRLNAARDTITAASDVLQSIVTDATSTATEALRKTSLFIKSVAGLTQTLKDFPDTIKKEALPLIVADWNNLRTQFEGLISPQMDHEFRSAQTSSQLSVYSNLTTLFPGGSRDDDLDTLFSTLSPSALKFTQNTVKQIKAEQESVTNLTRLDFQNFRDSLSQIADQFSFSIGGGNATYANTFGLAIPTTTRTPTQSEFDVMLALNETLIILDRLSASGQIDPPVPTSIEYVAGLAQKSGIAFIIPQSKFAVPFPYGFTLERLALKYLGDANRWHEIAILNGLREPYVDEVGFTLPLLTNGAGNQIIVSDAKLLSLGQTIWLSGGGQRLEKRHINKIDTITVGNVVITLDGEANLERFTTNNKSELQAFLPGTVNSQQILYIPSDNAAALDPETSAVPGVNQFDPLLQVGGIDLLLTQDGDLAITPDGDCRIAFGLANIVQTVKIALGTPQNSLLQHPDFGIDLQVGASTADISAQDILKSANSLFAGDPTFTGIQSASVLKQGNTTFVNLEVGVAGSSQFIPISIQVNR